MNASWKNINTKKEVVTFIIRKNTANNFINTKRSRYPHKIYSTAVLCVYFVCAMAVSTCKLVHMPILYCVFTQN